MSSFIYWYGGKVSDTVYLFFSDRPFFKHRLISEDVDKCIFDRASNRPLDWCKFWITLHNASKFVSWIISTVRFGYYCNIPVSCHEDVSAQQIGYHTSLSLVVFPFLFVMVSLKKLFSIIFLYFLSHFVFVSLQLLSCCFYFSFMFSCVPFL